MTAQVKDSGLGFHPRAGTLLMCDFRGSLDPEINKRRPVIVITPRLMFRDKLAMIVPTSTTQPENPQPFQVRLSKNYHPNESEEVVVWAKCDLVCSVSFQRLDRFKVGFRKFEAPRISDEDLAAVRQGVLAALGFVNLTITNQAPISVLPRLSGLQDHREMAGRVMGDNKPHAPSSFLRSKASYLFCDRALLDATAPECRWS